MAGRARENLPGGSLKYLFVYLKIRIFKCSYRIYNILTFYLAFHLAFHLEFYHISSALAFYLTSIWHFLCSGILSCIYPDILFGIYSGIFLATILTSYLPFCLACVRVHACPAWSGARDGVELAIPNRTNSSDTASHISSSGIIYTFHLTFFLAYFLAVYLASISTFYLS